MARCTCICPMGPPARETALRRREANNLARVSLFDGMEIRTSAVEANAFVVNAADVERRRALTRRESQQVHDGVFLESRGKGTHEFR